MTQTPPCSLPRRDAEAAVAVVAGVFARCWNGARA
jgi:hypothetical protein